VASSSVEGRNDGKVAGGGEGEGEARVLARTVCLVGVKARNSPWEECCFWVAGRKMAGGSSSVSEFDSESEEESEDDDDDDLAEEMAILEVFGTDC